MPCFAAAVTLEELHTKEKAIATNTAELAERQADLQAREAALKGAQASLEAQMQQLASEQQAGPLKTTLLPSTVVGIYALHAFCAHPFVSSFKALLDLTFV